MDLLCRRNLAIYRKTPTYAKTPAVAAQLEQLHVPCAGVMPVGLDTAIIPNANGEKHELREFLKLDPKANYLVFVGRLDSYKRPLDLVPVLEALPRSWNAVVIGQGSLTGELQDALRTHKLENRCTCIPQLPNATVQAYYHACDVFVNFNDGEIFGMSLLEAMYAAARRLPAMRRGRIWIIEPGTSGYFADTPAQFAEAIQKAAADPACGHAAQRRVNEHFLWANSAETALAMLDKQGGNRRG